MMIAHITPGDMGVVTTALITGVVIGLAAAVWRLMKWSGWA